MRGPAILLIALAAGAISAAAPPALSAEAPSKKAEKRAEKKAEPQRPQPKAAEVWWNRAWAARRSVTFEKEPAKDDPVLLIAGTAGLARPDARDLRLIADHRVQLPLEIVEVGPGDLAAVAFEAIEPGHALHLYLGYQHAEAPRRLSRDFRTGLRLEIRALAAGDAGKWQDMSKLLKACGEPLGVLFPDTVRLGVPPLGRSRDFLARYEGILRIEKAGEYLLETASDGASFVLVDGKPVAGWPGFHDLGGYADEKKRKEHSGTASLPAGLHTLEYLVATRSGGPHVLGMKGPDDPFPRPIPPERFVRWVRARPGPLESGGEAAADFSWRILSDSGSDAERQELALLEFRWSGDLAGRELLDVEWDFGDGQKGKGNPARHVYLGHGIFPVTARAQAGAGKMLEAARRVGVRFESLQVADLNRLLEEYHRLARDYDLPKLGEEHLARLIWLSKKDFSWEEDLHRAVETYFERGYSLRREGIARDGIRRARRLVQEREGFDRAEAILERAARESPGEGDRRDAAAWLARSRMLREDARRDEAVAEAALRKVRAEGGSSDPGRRASLFLGDLLLARGKAEEAEKILGELEEGPGRKYEGDRQVASGARALGFDNLLRRGELREAREELERWEWELPRDLLAGDLQLRKAALFRKEKKLGAARRELEQVLKLPRATNQVPRALLLEAEILVEEGNRDGARKLLQRIPEEFPARPERKEAEERLEALAR